MASPAGARVNPLASADQRALESLALRLFAAVPVQQAMSRMRPLFAADARAAGPAGRATLEQNLREWAFSATFAAAAMDPARPCVGWTLNLPHRWLGLDVPGSRHGVDNPDNIYRVIAVDEVGRFEIHGRVPARPAADVSFTLFSAYPGDGADSRSLGVVTLDELEVERDGRFVLTVGPQPAAGRRNHLQSAAGARLVFVRDSLHDWAQQTPLHLDVRRLDTPATEAVDENTLAERAAARVERAVPYWIASMPKWFGALPMNEVPKAGAHNFSYARQATAAAQWKLADDEALLITVDPLGAAYLGLQIADPWGSAPDYAAHQASLNAAQACADADGTITFAIARHDPGLPNWIDSAGLEQGTLLIRWQGLAPGALDAERSVRRSVLVKLAAIEQRFGAAQRRAQLAERSAAYARRLCES